MQAILNPEQLMQIQAAVDKISTSDVLLDYVQKLIAYTREQNQFEYGLSPRGALALLQAAKAWALIHNRKHVIPEDIQAVFIPVVGHRIRGAGEFADQPADVLLTRTLNSVDTV